MTCLPIEKQVTLVLANDEFCVLCLSVACPHHEHGEYDGSGNRESYRHEEQVSGQRSIGHSHHQDDIGEKQGGKGCHNSHHAAGYHVLLDVLDLYRQIDCSLR